MWLNLTSNEMNQLTFTDYERYFIDRLSVINGVAKVRIRERKIGKSL